MHTKKINSLQHPIVKHLVKLRENRSYRDGQGRVFVLGSRLIEQIAPHVKIHRILSLEPTSFCCDESLLVTHDILKKISGLAHPEPIGAEVSLPAYQNLENKKRLLGLDGISDPGNMGTLLRSALAFGFEGALIGRDSVDPFNDKALRAAKGASFLLPLQSVDFKAWQGSQVKLIADLQGERIENIDAESYLLILGNESHGPQQSLEGTAITLPMSGAIESLNVAVAGAILMYKLWEKRAT